MYITNHGTLTSKLVVVNAITFFSYNYYILVYLIAHLKLWTCCKCSSDC